MSCPHSTRPDASPASCSLCRGAVARRIEQVGGALYLDGELERAVEGGDETYRTYARRGGKAAARRTKTP